MFSLVLSSFSVPLLFGLLSTCHHNVRAPPSEPDLLSDRRDHGLPGQPLENDDALRSKLQL